MPGAAVADEAWPETSVQPLSSSPSMAPLNPHAPPFIPAVEAPPPDCYRRCPPPELPHSLGAPASPPVHPYSFYQQAISVYPGIIPLPWSAAHWLIQMADPFLAFSESVVLPSRQAVPLQPPPAVAWQCAVRPVRFAPPLLEIPAPTTTPMSGRAETRRGRKVRAVGPRLPSRSKIASNEGGEEGGEESGAAVHHRRPKPKRRTYCLKSSTLWVPKLRRYRKKSPEEAKLYEHFQFETGGHGGGGGGGGDRTTLMIKNIPNKLTTERLVHLLDDHCFQENSKLTVLRQQGDRQTPPPSQFDFFYLPVDFRTGCNLGYAFVNFTSAAAAKRLHLALHQTRWWKAASSSKVCEITYARIQGIRSLQKHFRGTTFRCGTPDVLPIIFAPPRDGVDRRQGPHKRVGRFLPCCPKLKPELNGGGGGGGGGRSVPGPRCV